MFYLFLLFISQTSDAAELALHLDGNTLRKRNISVKRYRPSAKSTLEKPLTQKPVRHKTLDDNARVKLSAGDEKRMAKKAKRKMRREGERALGIERKKKKRDDKTVSDQTKEESNESNGNEIKKNKHIRFQGQTVEESKKKKVLTLSFFNFCQFLLSLIPIMFLFLFFLRKKSTKVQLRKRRLLFY